MRRRGSLAALLALMLAGCGSVPDGQAADRDETRLFKEAYAGIARYYIDPVTPGALALAGLRNLSSIDGTVSVEEAGDTLLLHHGDKIMRFPVPAPRDSEGWAATTEAVVKAARAQSPALVALTADRLDETVIDGSIGLLDRFSHYAAPEQARDRRAARDGFGGIGITLNAEESEIRIVEVLAEAPAAEAGLQVGDRILAIDGVETATLPREEVAQRLRGPVDSLVTLTIARDGTADHLTVSMHRTRIVPPTVTLTEEHGIAHLRVTSFNQETADSVTEFLAQAHRDMGSGLRGIILDLRDNPGGLLDQSIDVASLFLDGRPVTSTVGRVPESIQYFTAPHRAVERLPLAVLVNGGSASASEIVASALQDSGRAVIVGSSSYGKGTVQNVQPMPNDGELTITWAKLITPGGYVLHQHGVVPTVCTVDLPDGTDGIAKALARSSGVLGAALAQPRAKLDEAGWQKLRQLCPGQRDDHAIEVEAAERLLADPVLYARALNMAPTGAAHPLTTAGVLR